MKKGAAVSVGALAMIPPPFPFTAFVLTSAPKSQGRPARRAHVQVRHDGPVAEDDAADPDLLIDFAKVSLRRGGQVLVGPVTWSVELDERWVVVGPNGAGKTSLLRIAAAMEHPSSGTAYVLGERLGGSTCPSCAPASA